MSNTGIDNCFMPLGALLFLESLLGFRQNFTFFIISDFYDELACYGLRIFCEIELSKALFWCKAVSNLLISVSTFFSVN